MKEEKQKTPSGCHAEAGTESRGMHGVQTCMGIKQPCGSTNRKGGLANAYCLAEQHEHGL